MSRTGAAGSLPQSLTDPTPSGSYEGGFASWSHDFDVVCKRSFGRRLMPHILLDEGIDKERSIMRVVSVKNQKSFQNL